MFPAHEACAAPSSVLSFQTVRRPPNSVNSSSDRSVPRSCANVLTRLRAKLGRSRCTDSPIPVHYKASFRHEKSAGKMCDGNFDGN